MDSEEKLLLSKAEDTMRIAQKRYSVKTLGFLNPVERLFLTRNLLPDADMQVIFNGGYPDAERTLLVCAPDFLEPLPEEYLSVLECSGRDLETLTHRDYLGSLMGLGIVRESIGDILVADGKGFIFVKPSQVPYILQNLTKIGRHGIRIRECNIDEVVIPEPDTKEIQTTVSSLRLDSVLAAATNLARGKAAELIQAGLVTVNWETEEEVSCMLKEGDMLSVRGYGRIRLTSVGGLTRKGRQAIVVSRYV
ncbi:MAG: RNA-binding protein [Clostridia bacterium]|nr:RNA-binding protein [Clostridia bacterium]